MRFRPRIRHCLAAAALACSGVLAAEPDEGPLKLNPFHDPFVSATSGRACPAPRGPAYSEARIRREGHYRAERGESCFVDGRCAESSAYKYDERIATGVVAALRADASLADTAIWVISEGRVVSLQGCVGTAEQAA
ncbi:MAG TPA: BON domain-containing protein, partial [Methylibium sp.]